MSLKLESTTVELRKGSNLAWYHHLTHITCVQKLRGLRNKMDALRVQLDHLFQSTRVSHKNSSLQRHFIFLSLFQLNTSFESNMHHSKPHTENSTLSDFIC